MPSCIGSPAIKTVGISLVAPLAASSEGDAPVRDNHRNPTTDGVGRHLPQSVISASRPPVFDDHVLTLNLAGFIQAPMHRADELCEGAGRLAREASSHWHSRPP